MVYKMGLCGLMKLILTLAALSAVVLVGSILEHSLLQAKAEEVAEARRLALGSPSEKMPERGFVVVGVVDENHFVAALTFDDPKAIRLYRKTQHGLAEGGTYIYDMSGALHTLSTARK